MSFLGWVLNWRYRNPPLSWGMINLINKATVRITALYRVKQSDCEHKNHFMTNSLGHQCPDCGKVLETWIQMYSKDEAGRQALSECEKDGVYF